MPDNHDTLNLSVLPKLQEQFEALNRGHHLNRHHDHALWADLERNQQAYTALFNALGYQLAIDPRGFAWLQPAEATANVSQTSRRLALFFLLLFEYQADLGMHLGKFQTWIINRELLEKLLDKNRPLLEAEALLSVSDLVDVLRPGIRYGIVKETSQGWTLLPATYRYLDHFEALAGAAREQDAADSSLIIPEESL
jgi:hypothetical protein